MRHEWDGWFSAELPSDWIAQETGEGVIEMTSPRFDAAIHFSFLKKQKKQAPTETAAENVVEYFARNNQLLKNGEFLMKKSSSTVRVWADFAAVKPGSECPKFWTLGCVLWADAAVRISISFDERNTELDTVASQVICGIERA